MDQTRHRNARPGEIGGRERLLQAAASAFAENGFQGASIAAIARQARVSKSTVFHHFATKEALYGTVISQAAADFGRRLDQLLDHRQPPGDVLRAFQSEHLNHIRRNQEVSQLVLRELKCERILGPQSEVMQALQANFERLHLYLEREQKEGRLRAGIDTEIATLLLFATNVFVFEYAEALRRIADIDLGFDDRRLVQAVVEIVYQGMSRTDRQPS